MTPNLVRGLAPGDTDRTIVMSDGRESRVTVIEHGATMRGKDGVIVGAHPHLLFFAYADIAEIR